MTTHIQDVSKMYFEDDPIEPIKWDFLSCGRRHSIIALEQGGFFIWGDNELGQLGNKKRRVRPLPLLRQGFSIGFSILEIVCSHDNSAVVVQRPEKKRKSRKISEKDSSNDKAKEDLDVLERRTQELKEMMHAENYRQEMQAKQPEAPQEPEFINLNKPTDADEIFGTVPEDEASDQSKN